MSPGKEWGVFFSSQSITVYVCWAYPETGWRVGGPESVKSDIFGGDCGVSQEGPGLGIIVGVIEMRDQAPVS